MKTLQNFQKLDYWILIELKKNKYHRLTLNDIFREMPVEFREYDYSDLNIKLKNLEKVELIKVSRGEGKSLTEEYEISEKGEKAIVDLKNNNTNLYDELISYFPEEDFENRIFALEMFIFQIVLTIVLYYLAQNYPYSAPLTINNSWRGALNILYGISAVFCLGLFFGVVSSPLSFYTKTIGEYFRKWGLYGGLALGVVLLYLFRIEIGFEIREIIYIVLGGIILILIEKKLNPKKQL